MTFEEFILQQFERFTFKTEEQIDIDLIEQRIAQTDDVSREDYMHVSIINLLKKSQQKKMLELINFILQNYAWLVVEYKSFLNNK